MASVVSNRLTQPPTETDLYCRRLRHTGSDHTVRVLLSAIEARSNVWSDCD